MAGILDTHFLRTHSYVVSPLRVAECMEIKFDEMTVIATGLVSPQQKPKSASIERCRQVIVTQEHEGAYGGLAPQSLSSFESAGRPFESGRVRHLSCLPAIAYSVMCRLSLR